MAVMKKVKPQKDITVGGRRIPRSTDKTPLSTWPRKSSRPLRADDALCIKRATRRSFRNIRDAARHLQDKPHDPIGTAKVQASSLSCVRRIQRETGMGLAEIEDWASQYMRVR